MKYYTINRSDNITDISIGNTVFYVWYEDFTERKLLNAMRKLGSQTTEKIAFNDKANNRIILI